jgi:outer membrane protein TolC
MRALALLVVLAAPAAAAQDRAADALVQQALERRPELQAAQARARGERARVAREGALPDPMLSVGIQNDGFDGIEIGTMETSYLSVMLSQGLPWPGKRGLRARVAELAADEAGALVDRARLDVEAEVRTAYVELLLARERLVLLDELAALWAQSEELARARYEVASAPQSDVLRAQLERSRLRSRRLVLAAEERQRRQNLNRAAGAPVEDDVATSTRLRDLADPPLLPAAEELADAEARSPELRAATLAARRAEARERLASRERFPDLGVSAGVMPRGGLEPMWQLGVSIELPVLSRRGAAVAEARELARAERAASQTTAQLLGLRVAERRAALEALRESLALYRDGVLVQSSATVESTLAQYRVGRVGFASVLEALAGRLADEESYLATIAGAQRVAIARAAVSLEPPGAM